MQLSHVPASARHLHRAPNRPRRDGGYILVTFAIALVPLLLMVGFSVDVGSWYNHASDIQKAADAASLAGVVFLPDEAEARRVALETAKKNGFDNAAANITVTVTKSAKAPNRLKVTILDRRVGSFFYGGLVGGDISMQRTSFAEYVTPVPMGSPRNFFGTGSLLTGPYQESMYQSVNTYCASKANGDRHQSGFDTGQNSNTQIGANCKVPAANADYRSEGYELYIDAVPTRPSDIELRLLDPQFTTASSTRTVPDGQTCTTTYTYTYPTDPNAGWTTQSSSGNRNGPIQFQTRNNSSSQWGPIQSIDAGQSVYLNNNNRARYRGPSSSTPTTTCVDKYKTVTDTALDRYFSGSIAEDYTVKLYSADNTPLDDSDNPEICSQTFTKSTPYSNYSYLNIGRWNTMQKDSSGRAGNDCIIKTTMPSGRYILRITNSGVAASSTNKADGENNWGLVARYTSSSGDGLCDGRTDVLCPRVYGKDAISVRAVSDANVADFFLAEIASAHAGKKLKIELWDPGEGGQSIEILQPTGPDTWATHRFNWSEPANGSGTNVSILSVTDSKFNARLVTIVVDLTGYNPPVNNNWWKIRYRFSGSGVTDRTTWSAKILGDPVHLIEE